MSRGLHRQAPRGRTPGSRPSRFPGFDVLDEVDRWDAVTAGVVLARLTPSPELSFFTGVEQATAEALCDQLLAQHDEPRVPVAALIDVRLATGETDGWHYADMPEDGEAWRQTLAFLDDDATARYGATFGELTTDQQAGIVQAVQNLDTRDLARPAGEPGVVAVDAIRMHRVLLAPVGVERDRLPRPGLPARLQEHRHRQA